MNLINKYFVNSNNIRIFYRMDVPFDAKAIIIISHGYGEHSGHYLELCDFLVKNKYGVYAIDHRNHGQSEGRRGDIDSFFDFISDFDEMVSIIQDSYPEKEIYTFGHSMGGLITFVYGLMHSERGIKGQIFSGPALTAPWGLYMVPMKFYDILGKAIPKAKVYRIVKKRASRNYQYFKEFQNDPYDLKYSTIGFLKEFLYKGITWAQENAEKYTLPCLFLHGTSDKIIPYERVENTFERVTSQDKTLKLYEHCYHELIHEPEREEIMNDILDWLEKRINK